MVVGGILKPWQQMMSLLDHRKLPRRSPTLCCGIRAGRPVCCQRQRPAFGAVVGSRGLDADRAGHLRNVVGQGRMGPHDENACNNNRGNLHRVRNRRAAIQQHSPGRPPRIPSLRRQRRIDGRDQATDTDAEDAVHYVSRRGTQVAQAGDMPQFVFHDGQQVDVGQGPRVNGTQL